MPQARRAEQTPVKLWTEEIARLLSEPQVPEETPKVICNFEIPKWWECTWRRTPCKKRTCRFCRILWVANAKISREAAHFEGELMRNDELSERTGRAIPDVMFSDADDELPEEELPDAEEEEPPEPDKFLLYRRLVTWAGPIGRYMHSEPNKKSAWAKTNAAKDLVWYSALLPSKLYRQLATKWEVARLDDDDEGQEFGSIETGYTGYVIRQCVSIIESSLIELSREKMHPPFKTVLADFRRLKPSVLAFAPRKQPNKPKN